MKTLLLCRAVHAYETKISYIDICLLSRGNYTEFYMVYCNTQLLIFRFSFLHIT